MLRMIALRDISDSVGIRAGQIFGIQDTERAEVLISQGQAKWYEEAWTGLKWHGATACIIASGPSLTEDQCEVVRKWREHSMIDHKVIVINTSFRLAPWADVLYACDVRWWDTHCSEVHEKFKGQLWSQDEKALRTDSSIRIIKSVRASGLNKEKGFVNQGYNGGYQAVGLAYQAGVKRMVLLGYDMNEKGGTHWHGDHPRPLQSRANFPLWIECFKKLAQDLLSAGVEVINATPRSSLPCFKKKPLEEALS